MKNKFQNFKFGSFRYESLSAMVFRNKGQSIAGLILRLIPTMEGNTTVGMVKGIKQTLYHFSKIAHYQGMPGLIKRLKAASVSIQQSLGGYVTPMPLIARTASGLPRFLPSNFRSLIRSGNKVYIRLSLTLTSLYRDIMIPGKIDLSSVTDPFTGNFKQSMYLVKFIPRFVTLFCGKYGGKEALIKKFSYFVISKSSPQSKGVISTDPYSLVRSAKVLSPEQISNLSILFGLSTKNRFGITVTDPIARINLARSITSTFKFVNPFDGFSGKIGIKEEAAGKMRVFAMVDPWTQLAMAPLHKALFRILSKHHMIDGTFNQLGPIERLWGMKALKPKMPLYSMDLSSATDRLPLFLQKALIAGIFSLSDKESSAWTQLLVERSYKLPKAAIIGNVNSVKYAVGQPMGALSSWAMLAMTHHFIVQCAAWLCGFSKHRLFTEYCVLGDDIVIYNHKVAKRYHYLMTQVLGVKCQLAKSVLSPKGLGLEFAKKTFYMGVNVSPSPLKEFFSALQSITMFCEYSKKYKLNPVGAAKVAGFGWRVQSSMNKPWLKLNFKMRYYLLTLAFTSDTFYSTLKKLRPHLNSIDILSAYLGMIQDILETTLKSISEQLMLAENLDIDDPGNRVTSIFIRDLKPRKGRFVLTITKSIVPPELGFLYPISHVQAKWALEIQSTVIRILKPLIAETKKIHEDIAYLRLRLLRGRLSEVELALPHIFSSLQSLIRIKAKASSRSIESLWGRDTQERRPGAPKAYALHNAFASIADKVKDLAKRPIIMSDIRSSDDVMQSGFVPQLRFMTRFLKPSFIAKIAPKVIKRSVLRTGYWFTLLSLVSSIVGIVPVLECVLMIWTAIQTLLGIIEPDSCKDTPYFSYVGNFILHSIEMYFAAMILVTVYHYHLYYSLILVEEEMYNDGVISIFTLIYDLLRFQNDLLLGTINDQLPVIKDFIDDSIRRNGITMNFFIGFSLSSLLFYLIKFMIGL